MKTISDFWTTLRTRWHNAMPRFFKRMMWLGGLLSGTAIAVHEVLAHYGIQPDDWWIFIERYLIGGGAGVVFACKFTQSYDKDGKPLEKEIPEATQPAAVNDSDVETQQPHDIDTNNDIQ